MKTVIATIAWLLLAPTAPADAVVAIRTAAVETAGAAAAAPTSGLLQHVAGDPVTLLTLSLGIAIAMLVTRSRRQPPTVTV